MHQRLYQHIATYISADTPSYKWNASRLYQHIATSISADTPTNGMHQGYTYTSLLLSVQTLLLKASRLYQHISTSITANCCHANQPFCHSTTIMFYLQNIMAVYGTVQSRFKTHIKCPITLTKGGYKLMVYY